MHWFFDRGFTKASVRIAEDELRHLRSLRIRINEEIAITDGSGQVFYCRMVKPELGTVEVLGAETVSRKSPRLHLVQALAKGDRDEQALQMAVELGVASVTPWQAEHSIAKWSQRAEKNRLRWQEIADSAMKQSHQAYQARVEKLAVTGDLRPQGEGVLLNPAADRPIGSLSREIDELTVVVGPEGGFAALEIQQLSEQGFEGYRLGDSVLRTSTAGPAAISAILALTGRW
jgi:16S rRNA (uracil1498-N3)-methyltransferase